MKPEVDVSWVSERPWRLVIGGELVEASDGSFYDNLSPVTEDVICRVPNATADDVEAAVQAGQKAFEEWRRVPVRERARVVRRLANVVREHREELAALDAIDVGNAYTFMLNDADDGADGLDFMADMAWGTQGETLPATGTHLHYTRREPLGVVARIVAFNHPIMFAAQKVAAPLVAGNAVILKPSDLSPLSALRMGELFAEHLPPGLLNVIVGQGPTAPRALVRHPAIRRIGFIGSETTGRAIQRDAAEVGVKDITLELGGKNALIVCADAPIEEAAAGVVKGMNFRGWQSQSCSSTSRLLVHESIADELVAAVRERMAAVKIGSPLRPDTEMGPLSSRTQYDKVTAYVEIARAEGATLVYGGDRPVGDDFERGFYISPTMFDHVQPDMRIANEEVFGPVLSVIRFRDEATAVAIANSVGYGLTGGVFTRDIGRAHRIAHELDTGYVWINDAAKHFTGIPFGGYKASGLGKEESLEELISYTQLKSISVHLDR
jgi:acyl-CoA reductase-like NAD-dependent aldehyde dehydrogenase